MTKSQAVQIPVRYAETDASGMAWHGSYAAWLEVGRVKLLEALGLPYTQVQAAGYAFVIAELQVRYLAPARFGDTVVVQARFSEVGSRAATIEYEVRNAATGQLLATARTFHVCLGPNGKVTSFPAEWIERLRAGG